MIRKAKVENGMLAFEEPLDLPDGTVVDIDLIVLEETKRTSLSEKLLKHAGKAKGLPSDLARNHDHYLYGTGKR